MFFKGCRFKPEGRRRMGVRPGSYTFSTELFAPLLGVVCVKDLKEAVSVEMTN